MAQRASLSITNFDLSRDAYTQLYSLRAVVDLERLETKRISFLQAVLKEEGAYKKKQLRQERKLEKLSRAMERQRSEQEGEGNGTSAVVPATLTHSASSASSLVAALPLCTNTTDAPAGDQYPQLRVRDPASLGIRPLTIPALPQPAEEALSLFAPLLVTVWNQLVTLRQPYNATMKSAVPAPPHLLLGAEYAKLCTTVTEYARRAPAWNSELLRVLSPAELLKALIERVGRECGRCGEVEGEPAGKEGLSDESCLALYHLGIGGEMRAVRFVEEMFPLLVERLREEGDGTQPPPYAGRSHAASGASMSLSSDPAITTQPLYASTEPTTHLHIYLMGAKPTRAAVSYSPHSVSTPEMRSSLGGAKRREYVDSTTQVESQVYAKRDSMEMRGNVEDDKRGNVKNAKRGRAEYEVRGKADDEVRGSNEKRGRVEEGKRENAKNASKERVQEEKRGNAVLPFRKRKQLLNVRLGDEVVFLESPQSQKRKVFVCADNVTYLECVTKKRTTFNSLKAAAVNEWRKGQPNISHVKKMKKPRVEAVNKSNAEQPSMSNVKKVKELSVEGFDKAGPLSPMYKDNSVLSPLFLDTRSNRQSKVPTASTACVRTTRISGVAYDKPPTVCLQAGRDACATHSDRIALATKPEHNVELVELSDDDDVCIVEDDRTACGDQEPTALCAVSGEASLTESTALLCAFCAMRALGSCSKCMTTYYCSEECLVKHWNLSHRLDCSATNACK